MNQDLKVKRQILNHTAKEAYEKIFGKPRNLHTKKIMNTQQMYELLKNETQKQLSYAKKLQLSYLHR